MTIQQQITEIKARIARLTALIQAMEAVTTHPTPQDLEMDIKAICAAQGVPADIALKVANCESGMDILAVNENGDQSIDRGIFQINDIYHPEMSDADCFDHKKSTEFFCKAYNLGQLNWWNSSKTCWAA